MAVLHNRGKLLDSFCVLGLFVVGIICRVWTLETLDFRMFDNSLKVLKDCCFISKQSEHTNMELMKVARGPKGETKLVSAGCIRQFSESHPTIFKSNPPNQPRTNKFLDVKQEVHDSSPHPTLPITFNQLPTSNEGSQ